MTWTNVTDYPFDWWVINCIKVITINQLYNTFKFLLWVSIDLLSLQNSTDLIKRHLAASQMENTECSFAKDFYVYCCKINIKRMTSLAACIYWKIGNYSRRVCSESRYKSLTLDTINWSAFACLSSRQSIVGLNIRISFLNK